MKKAVKLAILFLLFSPVLFGQKFHGTYRYLKTDTIRLGADTTYKLDVSNDTLYYNDLEIYLRGGSLSPDTIFLAGDTIWHFSYTHDTITRIDTIFINNDTLTFANYWDRSNGLLYPKTIRDSVYAPVVKTDTLSSTVLQFEKDSIYLSGSTSYEYKSLDMWVGTLFPKKNEFTIGQGGPGYYYSVLNTGDGTYKTQYSTSYNSSTQAADHQWHMETSMGHRDLLLDSTGLYPVVTNNLYYPLGRDGNTWHRGYIDTIFTAGKIAGTSDSILVREDNTIKYKLGSTAFPNYWTQDHTEHSGTGRQLYPADVNDSIGIGTNEPSLAKLHIVGNIYAVATNPVAIFGASTNAYGGQFGSTNSSGLYVTSTNGDGFNAQSTAGVAGNYVVVPSSTNTMSGVVKFARHTSGTAQVGMGGYEQYYIQNAAGTNREVGRFGWKYTDITNLQESSSFEWWNIKGGTVAKKMELDSSGVLGLAVVKLTGTDTTGHGSTANIGKIMYYNGHFYGLIAGAPPTWKQLDN